MPSASPVPVSTTDPVNEAILRVSEDQLQGFVEDPIGVIAQRTSLPVEVVVERLRAMLAAGTIRRIRQTLVTTNLAQGALVAWRVPEERLRAAFDWMFAHDPFTGHVVVRSTDPGAPGAAYRLWTTVKVPPPFPLERHCEVLAGVVGAQGFRIMPAKYLFTLGVGHVRRRHLPPGSRSDISPAPQPVRLVTLNDAEWRVLLALKREVAPEELGPALWRHRAAEAGIPYADFIETVRSLETRGLIGRFSTFLEHVKPNGAGERVTRYNALFHWAVAPGQELAGGCEVARHHVVTHAYWREAGPDFGNVNIMAVVHGREKEWVLAHKRAIDEHLREAGIAFAYTNVFWGGRSEIKPSEVSPFAYEAWLTQLHSGRIPRPS
ncbi:MAG: Lrp/AsnC family transcriptional regulator [Chloroflexota bacterium]|nr:Lrp/AsnC family transcriptional regulator [Dehalococcoidia bacterium]MDW8046840.1 Lrp/AsnC family transcriptional regulator [Chloroflexota bacterium]